MSTSNSVPGAACSTGTYAMPIAFFRNGVCVPLVTDADLRRRRRRRRSRGARCRGRSSRSRRASARRRRPSARAAPSAPMKSSFFQPTIQPRSASSARRRLVDVVAVEAHRRLRAAACRARRGRTGSTPARPAGLEQRLPDAVGRLRRHEDLEAVLAGVAGARDGRADAGHLAVREPVVLHARRDRRR